LAAAPPPHATLKIAERSQFQGWSCNDLFPATLIVATPVVALKKARRDRRDAVRHGLILTTRSKMRMIVQPSYCPSHRTTTPTSKPPEINRNDVPETRSQSTVACGQIRVTDETPDSGPQLNLVQSTDPPLVGRVCYSSCQYQLHPPRVRPLSDHGRLPLPVLTAVWR
jgi:hypothetical protein